MQFNESVPAATTDGSHTDQDLGPLAWVLEELRKSLEGAVKSMRRFVRDTEAAKGSDLSALDTSALRIARQQMHQASGALEMVSMMPPVSMVRAMEAAVQKFIQRPELCDERACGTIEKASFALIEYLDAILAGKLVSSVGLFPQYRDVQVLAGGERVHPADLWPVERRSRDPQITTSIEPIGYSPEARARLDNAVLRVVKSGDVAAARELRDMCLGFMSAQSEAGPRLFWKLCSGFMEAFAFGLLPSDVYVKRAASRVLLQYTTMARGDSTVAERLIQDLLFFCSQASPAEPASTPVLSAIRKTYALDRFRPVDYEVPRFGRFDPAVLMQARKRIAVATETWSALAGGDKNKLKAAADQFALVGESLRKLSPDSEPLAQALTESLNHTVRSGEAPPTALAMEVATAVLYLQASFEDLNATDDRMAVRAVALAGRLERVRQGGEPEPLESWMEDLYRRVSDTQTMGSVVDELRATLGEAEKGLDQFFRDPDNKQPLVAVPTHLSQMRGVLSVLGLDQASLAVLRMRERVENLMVDDLSDKQARDALFEKLGNSLGALGFMIDMLSYQRALARKLFVYDEELGELRLLMGRSRGRGADPVEEVPVLVAERMEPVQPALLPEPVSAIELDAFEAAVAAAAAPAAEPAPAAERDVPAATPAAAPVQPAAHAAPAASTAAGAKLVPVPAAGVSERDVEEEELLDIFLEEAREVNANGLAAIAALAADPAALTEQTTLRRAFHTLKGSSRMVGLNEFGEAAWSMEQLLNTWLADQKPASADLLQVTGDGLRGFARWVEDIAAHQDGAWHSAPFRACADALRLDGRATALVLPEVATALPVPGGAEPAAVADAPVSDPVPDEGRFMLSDALLHPTDFQSTEVSEDLDETNGRSIDADLPSLDVEGIDFLQIDTVDTRGTANAPVDAPAFQDAFQAEVQPPLPADLELADLSAALEDTPIEPEQDGEIPLPAIELPIPAPANADPVPLAVELPSLELDAVAPQAEDEEALPPDAIPEDAVGPAGFTENIGGDAEPDAQPSKADADDLAALDAMGVASSESAAETVGAGSGPDEASAVEAVPDVLELAEPAEASDGFEASDSLESEATSDADESVKVIETLRIGIPLYNVFLNEADEWSRRLQTELSEWAIEQHQRVPDNAEGLAHSLSGSSATVGFHALSDLSRALEHALQHVAQQPRVLPEQVRLFVDAGEDIRRVLHQFAAGFLKEAEPRILTGLREVLDTEVDSSVAPADDDVPSESYDTFDSLSESGVAESPTAAEAGASATAAANVPPVALIAPRADPVQKVDEGDARALEARTDLDNEIDAIDVIDPDLFPILEEEAIELLPQLGAALRQWAARPENTGARSQVLHVLHTLKGSSRMAGAMRMGEMAHRLESAIEHLGSENLQSQHIEPLLGSFDELRGNFDALRNASSGAQDGPIAVPPPVRAPADNEAVPAPDAGAAAALPSSDAVPHAGLSAVPAAAASSVVRPLIRTAPLAPRPLQARATANPLVRVRSSLLDRLVNQAGEVMISRSRLAARVDQLRTSLGDMSGNLDRLRQHLRDVELQAESQMQSRLALAKDSAAGFDPLEFDRFTRVQELTRMMAESVNDVATVQRNLQRTMEGAEDDLIAQGRQARELQRDLLRTRMVEFEGISERLYAVVRQAAKETGKQVKLDITGGTIEMDRGLLDRMTPAFEHLLRNAVAHGIEDATLRQSAGKPAAGTIGIELHHEGNDVSVAFSDDGGGLNLEAIRAKARAQGLLADGAEMDDAEAAGMIFMPGFSTAAQVTGLAGRGIGMDVVRSEVSAMGGRIETASDTGRGTRFKIVLPLTTAVTQVVMLRAGNLSIGVPANVVEVVRRTPVQELERAYATGMLAFDGTEIPFFWAGALLQTSGRSVEPAGKTRPVLVFRSAAQRVAVHVDEVLGNQEVVVKNLGPQLSRLPGLSGMSVLASGAVVLIYNPVALATVYGEQIRANASAQADAAQQAAADAEAAGTPLVPVLPVAAVANQVPLILVVDDSITVRRVTQRLLQREGYRVSLAADGLQALERLQEERPTVVLSDIEMPRMDGFDLARNIRADRSLQGLPIVMITSRIAEKHREHAMELGVNHYLGKPYSEEELLSLVRRYAAAEAEAHA